MNKNSPFGFIWFYLNKKIRNTNHYIKSGQSRTEINYEIAASGVSVMDGWRFCQEGIPSRY